MTDPVGPPMPHVAIHRDYESRKTPEEEAVVTAAIEAALARRFAGRRCDVCTASLWKVVDPPGYAEGRGPPEVREIVMVACANCGAMHPFARELLAGAVARGLK